MVLVGSGSGFRIQVFFIRIRNLDPDFHFLDPDPYENDRDPSHWVGTGSGTLSFFVIYSALLRAHQCYFFVIFVFVPI